LIDRPTVADFRALFNEFAQTSDEQIERAIDTSYTIYALSKRALLFLVAHILTLETEEKKLDGGQGEVRVERIGKKQLEYITQASSAGESFYTTSFYGRIHIQLRKASPSRLAPRVIG